jgi:short-subunit dehydrogenase
MESHDNSRPLAVVTGASSGIGLALAQELAARDYDLVIAAEDGQLHEAAQELRTGGADVTAVTCDLASFDGVEALCSRVDALGRDVDVVAINAGVGVNGPLIETPLEDHLSLVELNVTGAVHLAHRMLPKLVASEGGMLFTSSIAATMPAPYMSTYAASKAFLLSFAEGLRVEMQDRGVTVTALMPGPTDTEFFARADMEDTKLGQAKKDDPRDVARDAVAALADGRGHVVAGSMKNKMQVAAAKMLPPETTAAMHGKLAEPGSASPRSAEPPPE